MKKISFKRIFIGTLIGVGLGIFLIVLPLRWLLDPDSRIFPPSDEEICTEEMLKQPYTREGFYQTFFNDCMKKRESGGEEIIDTSPGYPVEVEVTG